MSKKGSIELLPVGARVLVGTRAGRIVGFGFEQDFHGADEEEKLTVRSVYLVRLDRHIASQNGDMAFGVIVAHPQNVREEQT